MEELQQDILEGKLGKHTEEELLEEVRKEDKHQLEEPVVVGPFQQVVHLEQELGLVLVYKLVEDPGTFEAEELHNLEVPDQELQ